MKKPLKSLLGKSLPTKCSCHFSYCEMPYSELTATVLVLGDRTQGFLTILIIFPLFGFVFYRRHSVRFSEFSLAYFLCLPA